MFFPLWALWADAHLPSPTGEWPSETTMSLDNILSSPSMELTESMPAPTGVKVGNAQMLETPSTERDALPRREASWPGMVSS